MKDTLYLTGLRGYSAFAVFLIHSGGGGLKTLSVWTERIVEFGKSGVISFFVLSAFTLAMSIERSKKFDFCHYMLRRFARILPMYFLVMVCFWLLGGTSEYQNMFNINPHDPVDLLMHLTFLNLWDERYQSTIIGVEWTVPIEMWTYLVIPFVYFSFGRIRVIWQWGVFFFAVLISIKCKNWHDHAIGAQWAIEAYLYCFLGGIITFKFWKNSHLNEMMSDFLAVLIVFLIICLSIFAGGRTNELLTLLVMGLVVALYNARHARVIFENRLIVLLGNISFSFYLLHFPILHFLKSFDLPLLTIFVLGLAITTVVAYASHVYIEKPCLRLTGKLNPYDR